MVIKMCKHREQSQAPVTPWPPRASQSWHMDTATTSTCDDKLTQQPAKGTLTLSLIATDKDKKDCTWCSWSSWWLSPPQGDTSAGVVPVRSGVQEHLVTGDTLEMVTHTPGGDKNILWA